MSSAAPMQQAETEAASKSVQLTSQLLTHSNKLTPHEVQHADLRSQTTMQRQLQDVANHSTQSQQLKVLQHMPRNAVRATQLKSTQAMMNAHDVRSVGETEPLQKKSVAEAIQREAFAEGTKPNNTGLPDQLKSGIESLSGMSMDHVKVHYNSSQPAQLNAHAYAQGSEIHVAPGQETHLPHEAWHVVQQAQGRVQPTMQMKQGVSVNDDVGLEAEADVMGARAVQLRDNRVAESTLRKGIVQKVAQRALHVIQRAAVDINLNQVKAKDDGANITLTEDYPPLVFPNYADAKNKRAYIGTAIVWAGEKNAHELAKKYVEGSQDWSVEERKARLGVNFLINNREEFDTNKNRSLHTDTLLKTVDARSAVSDLVTTAMCGVTWSYAYTGGNLPLLTTAQVATAIESDGHNNDTYTWKKDGNTLNDRSLVRAAFGEARAEKGVPYGALRSKAGKQILTVENWLTKTNGASEAYVHSIDADAPDFSTLSEGEESDEWMNVLDAYDQELDDGEDADFIIGGYNLTADRDEFSGEHAEEDYRHTVKSNVVDTAIRMAVFSIEPTMIYPTEPNFLVKASTYRAVDEYAGKKNAWGNRAFEGRNFMDNYIRMQTKKKKGVKIAYNPLLSVPTGVGAGGSRLKITSGKKYDKDSIFGKPQGSLKSEGQAMGLAEQYVVQAQSWAGASRLASAYLPAALLKEMGVKKAVVIPLFAAVEQMAMALAKGEDPAAIETGTVNVTDFDKNEGKKMPIQPILNQIKVVLSALHKDKSFASIAPKIL